MKTNDIIIRTERENDYREVENLVRESFWNVYAPGCTEHFVLKRLRDCADFVPELDFVMEKDGKIIGQNVFVKTDILLDNGSKLPIMTMGPICIANGYKRMGYGKILLDYSLEKAKEHGCKAVCLEGSIDFYGKSGFVVSSTKGLRYHGLPDGVSADFFLCGKVSFRRGIFAAYTVKVNENDMRLWARQYAGQVKITEPAALAEVCKQDLKSTLALYEEE